MHFPGQTYPGPPLDDVAILERLPSEYAMLLAQRNGFVAFGGGLHVRGACTGPLWHSIREAWDGPAAIHRLFGGLNEADVPFAQDALGMQYVLRRELVHRWERGHGVRSLDCGVSDFLQRCLEHPTDMLPLDDLARLNAAGARLLPGELIEPGAPPRAVPLQERLVRLAVRAG